MVRSLLARLLGRKSVTSAAPTPEIALVADPVPAPDVSAADLTAARATLDALRRPVVAMRLGGQRPGDTRAASWWGGNFIADAPQGGLIPLCQIRSSDLPADMAALIGAEYLLIWHSGRDLFTEGVVIAAQDAPASLAPVEDRRTATGLPLFQLFPERPDQTQIPGWEDFMGHIPASVAQARDSTWFFEAPAYLGDPDCPVIVGGWPQWIQSSQWPTGGTFVLELRSTDKGRLFLGDAGSLYVFRTPDGWCVMGDCY